MNNKVHVFKDSIKVGDYGERIVQQYLKSSSAVSNIIDVSNSKMYQELGIDLIVKMKDGSELKVEVKTDTYKSGNIYYETISAKEVNSVGGFVKTECDYMLYYFLNMNTLYILEMDKYKEWFDSKEKEFIKKGYQKNPINRRWNGSTYTSVGYAYPVSILENEGNSFMSKVYLNKNNYSPGRV